MSMMKKKVHIHLHLGGVGVGGGVREGGRITSLFAVFCVFKCP